MLLTPKVSQQKCKITATSYELWQPISEDDSEQVKGGAGAQQRFDFYASSWAVGLSPQSDDFDISDPTRIL